MSSVPENSAAPPKTTGFSRGFLNLFYAVTGIIGMWRIAHPGPRGVDPFLMFMAVHLATMPMVIAHELGHFLAGWLAGFKTLVFNIGCGPVIYTRQWGDVNIVWRQWPITGHVKALKQEGASKGAHLFFIAGGPLANLALAAVIVWIAKLQPLDFFSNPTLAGVAVWANLWLAFLTLIPASNINTSAVGNGTDGWQLWRLLRNKPLQLDAGEFASRMAATKTGLPYLRAVGTRSKRVVAGALIFLALVFLAMWVMVESITHSSQRSGDTVKLRLLLGGLTFGLVGVAVRVLRRPWTSQLTAREKLAANPMTHHNLMTTRALTEQSAAWRLNDLSEETRANLVKSWGAPDNLPWLRETIKTSPEIRVLHIAVVDSLINGQHFAEAIPWIEEALTWPDLTVPVRDFFSTQLTASRLGAGPDESTIAACEAAVATSANDGMAMHRLLHFAAAIANPPHTSLLPQAEAWCRRAHDIFPFDNTIQLGIAATLIQQGRCADAQPWLLAVKAATSGSNDAVLVNAWTAVAAAKQGQPNAESLLRQSLKQPLPHYLIRRVTEALEALPR